MQIFSNPRKLFLVDGLGAILSAFLLGVVLVKLEPVFGIPKDVLYILAFIPCLFAPYDFYCYRQQPKNIGFYLKVIAVANLLYCAFSLGMAFFHQQELTFWGWGYIVGEILIVVALAILELQTARKLNAPV